MSEKPDMDRQSLSVANLISDFEMSEETLRAMANAPCAYLRRRFILHLSGSWLGRQDSNLRLSVQRL